MTTLSDRKNGSSARERVDKTGDNLLDGSLNKSGGKGEKAGETLLDVQLESDDKLFIYDIHENPPILMTIFFAMQVSSRFKSVVCNVFGLNSFKPLSHRQSLARIGKEKMHCE